MPIDIVKVSDRKSLKKFINFENTLFKGQPVHVPPFFVDEMESLRYENNPATEFCDFELYLAYKDGEIVGRVAAIVNHRANEIWNHKEVRYGWFDFIDDPEVPAALLAKVEEYGKRFGMDKMSGPLGFTDFDPEGMMVEGYDKEGTIALKYAYPYYKKHMEDLGFQKEIDWMEFRITIPKEIPDRLTQISKMVLEKYDLHVVDLPSKKVTREKWGHKLFDLINETYAHLFDFTILPTGMIDLYINKYLSLLSPKFVCIVADSNDTPVGFGISMPSITKALQKCGGKLFPFGWWHLLKSMYFHYEDTVELLLVGVKPEYQKKGVSAVIMEKLNKVYIDGGFKYAETNATLETNHNIQNQWMNFEYEQSKRRRVYTKSI